MYSEDIHAILELTQNADDNFYDIGVIPTLEIIVGDYIKGSQEEDDRKTPILLLTVNNNEIGFCLEDVRYLLKIIFFCSCESIEPFVM